jgi:putative heme-binding domain-containing protein
LRLAAIWEALNRLGKTFDRVKEEGSPEIRSELDKMDALLADARKKLKETSAPDALRIAAVKVMGVRNLDVRADVAALGEILIPQNSSAVQIAAVERLGDLKDGKVPDLLLRGWKSHPPVLRDRIVVVLLRRGSWRRALLNALDKHAVAAGEIETVRWQELLHGGEPSQKQRAERILAGLINPNRQKVANEFQSALSLRGDTARGKALFAKTCATCHKLGGAGQNVGPDLASRKDKSSASLLVAVLDPNRSVEPKYVAYVAVTDSGRTYTGVLADESANGLVLVGAKGERVELLRSEIDELTSTSKSLMPEGLEKDLSPQALADVIAYIQAFDAPVSHR